MNISELLSDKTMKPLEKRKAIADAVLNGSTKIQDLMALKVDDKKLALVFESIEELSSKTPDMAELNWLKFAESHMLSADNNIKREAARIIGNIAHRFPGDLGSVIPKLIGNAKSGSTIIRWSCAYALGKIIVIPKHADSDLYGKLEKLAEQEPMNGNKNQYLNGLKKAAKLRV